MTENNISTNPAINNRITTNENVDVSNNNNCSGNNKVPTSLKLKIPSQNNHGATGTGDATKPVKKKRRDKSDLGENFVAPDGGWGWLVAVAGGANILVSFALAQQFGIIFREHMPKLGITSSQLTTIINSQFAVSSFTGLLNGPLFRRYSYRQVALTGALLTFLGLFLSVFADSFIFYVCTFSCCYGLGRGLTVSASSLAVNTFFKQKRRTATAYQFGVAGLGPIFLPYLATFLLQFFGVQGTVLIFSGVSLHTFACALIYQPVLWHVRPVDKDAEALHNFSPEEEDTIQHTVEPDTPVLPRANDGWYGSRSSLYSPSYRARFGSLDRQRAGSVQVQEFQPLNSRDYHNSREYFKGKPRSISISYSIKEEDVDISHEHKSYEADDHNPDLQPLNNKDTSNRKPRTFSNSHSIKEEDVPKLTEKISAQVELNELDDAARQKLPFHKKVAIFFDLDLLRDITYVNLALGLTLINFAEINFAILTPFILSDFGFQNSQIALAMSSLGFCDLIIRFLIPQITSKMNFSNKQYFMIGISGMCIGRMLLSFTRNFYLMIAIFVWLGLNKAFRTVFWTLIIPGYVPLKRLPAAAGLQLLASGVFFLTCGPLLGLIRDSTNYAFTLNFLNALCVLALIMWGIEAAYRKHQRKRNPN